MLCYCYGPCWVWWYYRKCDINALIYFRKYKSILTHHTISQWQHDTGSLHSFKRSVDIFPRGRQVSIRNQDTSLPGFDWLCLQNSHFTNKRVNLLYTTCHGVQQDPLSHMEKWCLVYRGLLENIDSRRSTLKQTSNISHTLGNSTVDHSDVVGASPISAASTISAFST